MGDPDPSIPDGEVDDQTVVPGLAASQGRSEGLAEGLRHNVEDICELLDIELSRERRDFLAGATVRELEALRAGLKRDRRWDRPRRNP